ncbi:MAG: GNAT family N-acetyltransferase [Vulcanimicrobiota bacterium]
MTILETERLILSELKESHLEQSIKLLGDPQVMKYYPHPLNRKETMEWIQKNINRYKEHGFGIWGAFNKKNKKMLGHIGLVNLKIQNKDETALAYLLMKEFQGRGLATEGARACVEYAFTNLQRQQVVSAIRPENRPSAKVIEKLGFTPHGQCQLAGFNHVIYVINKTSWQNLK